MRQVNVIIEKHGDGYVAYPVGLKGIVVAQGDTLEAALRDVESAIAFHIETFGSDSIAEAGVEEVTVQTLKIAS